jgi:hypothetical protein
MRFRCPSAQFVWRAVLKDHSLAFTRFSTSRKCGVADVIHQPGHELWGIVYQLDGKDLSSLDGCEGFRPGRRSEDNAYNRHDDVRVLAEGDACRALTVGTYFASKQNDWVPPSDEYLQQIIDWACFWGLPSDYRQTLEQFIERVRHG